MTWFRTALRRMLGLFRKTQLDAELEEELRFHLDMESEQNIRHGMAPAEARRQARLQLGGVEQVKESHREARGLPFLESAFQDIRLSLRFFARNPGSTASAVITLTLGLGISTAVFSIVNAVLLKPLPYKDADQLVMVWNVNEQEGMDIDQRRSTGGSMSAREVLEWQEKSGIFEQMVGFSSWGGEIRAGDRRHGFFGYQVSPGLFPLLGVEPILGRGFLPEEEEPGGTPAMVLQYDFFQRILHGDASVIGQTVEMYGNVYRIVGVMPPGFVFFNRQIDALATLQMSERVLSSRGRYLKIMARLKPGVSFQQARSRADVFSNQMAQQFPETNEGWHAELVPLAVDAGGEMRDAMPLLLGAVICVLVIMCANVANLLLVQATGRARELAIRNALGAGRWRIVRQMLTQTLMLSIAGAVAGLGLAYALVRYFQMLLPDRHTWGKYLVQAEAVQVDGMVITFAFGSALAAGIVFGLLPALHVTGGGFASQLQDISRGMVGGRRGQAIRNTLVVAETAIAVVMVIGAGLLVRSFLSAHGEGPGFHGRNVLTLQVIPPRGNADSIRRQVEEQNLSRGEANEIYRAALRSVQGRLVEKLGALPGVEAVATTSHLPMSGWYFLGQFEKEGHAPDSQGEELFAVRPNVSRNYFEVMGLPLLRGRSFGPEDRRGTRSVAVVSNTVAQTFWPGEDPIGKRFKSVNSRSEDPWTEVIGVSADVREDGVGKPPKPYIYLSDDQTGRVTFMFFLRTTGDPYQVVPAVRQAAHALDPETIINRPRALGDMVRDSTWQLNYSMLLLGGLAGLALFLAVIGVYAVQSYLVRERTSEIGMRMALGAHRSQVMRLVMWQGLRLVGVGLVIGVLAAMALTELLEALLYGVEPTDPLTFCAVAFALLASALLACYRPALRATRIDPLEALRHE